MSEYNIIKTENTTPLRLEPEPIQPPSTASKVMRAGIAVMFILAMLYLYGGLHQYMQFTTTSDNIAAGEYQALVTEPTVSIPTTVFVLIEDESSSDMNVERLLERANQVLSQAAVEMDLDLVKEVPLTGTDLSGAQIVSNSEALRELLPSMEDGHLYVVVTRGLGGLNGVAFSGQRIVAVAEYTTSYDFRVLAHEVGHALGLDHVRDRSNLMYSGSSGTDLTMQQAQEAYDAAGSFRARQ